MSSAIRFQKNPCSSRSRALGLAAGLGAALWLCASPVAALAQTAVVDEDAAAVKAGTEAYLRAWTFTEEEGIDWDAFRPIFMPGPDGMSVVDTFGGGVTVLDSVDEYVRTWSPVVAESFVSLDTVAEDGIEVVADDEVAVSMFILRAEGVRPSGGDGLLRQHATVVWQPDSRGDWRIVREHLTTLP